MNLRSNFKTTKNTTIENMLHIYDGSILMTTLNHKYIYQLK